MISCRQLENPHKYTTAKFERRESARRYSNALLYVRRTVRRPAVVVSECFQSLVPETIEEQIAIFEKQHGFLYRPESANRKTEINVRDTCVAQTFGSAFRRSVRCRVVENHRVAGTRDTFASVFVLDWDTARLRIKNASAYLRTLNRDCSKILLSRTTARQSIPIDRHRNELPSLRADRPL